MPSTPPSTGVDGAARRGDAECDATLLRASFSPAFEREIAVENDAVTACLYFFRHRPPPGGFPSPLLVETDLSAQRAQAEAASRLPRQDVDPRRPRDPQAA